MSNISSTTRFDSRHALWLGIAFSLLFTVLIWVAGKYWMDPDRYARFAPRGIAAWFPMMWYRWQLGEPTVWTRATAWAGYIAHNLVIWYLIWAAQREQPAYSARLHRFNVLALLANVLFVSLHLLQTQFWYDGLAQDVSEFTSQASVTLMLVVILIMENDRRGMVLGAKAPVPATVGSTLRKYHGYYFAWAVIYTFWYHPMEITGGHLLGFLYMFLLLLQGSLFYTRMHLNHYWKVVAEVSVVAHAVMVAMLAGQDWPQFLGGFLGMFVLTQMHGLGLGKATRWLLGIVYIAGMLAIYGLTGDIARSYTAALIPAVEFGLAATLSLLMWLILLPLRNRPAAA